MMVTVQTELEKRRINTPEHWDPKQVQLRQDVPRKPLEEHMGMAHGPWVRHVVTRLMTGG